VANLTVYPATIAIAPGESAALSWSSTNAISGSGFNTNNATSGSVAIFPTNTTAYSVTCIGSGRLGKRKYDGNCGNLVLRL
jgi:hypothetical protein